MDLDGEAPVAEHQGQLPADEPDLAGRPVFKDSAAIFLIYICSICDNIPWKPRQTPCGHRCCADCIKEIFGDKEVIYTCPIGPDHSENEEHDLNNGYRMSDFVKDPACQLYLNNQTVLCTNEPNGCSFELPLRDLPGHLDKCEYKLTSCTNSDLCTEEFLRKHKNIHDDNCRYKEIKCEDCGVTVTRSALGNHWNDFCDRSIERSCKVCGANFLKRSDLKCHQRTKISSNHKPSCLKKGGVCYFSRYGCDLECDERDVNTMQEHLDDNYDKHMQRIVLTISEFSESLLRPIQMTFGQMSLSMSKFFKSVAESVPVFDSVPELLRFLNRFPLKLHVMNGDMQTSDNENETIMKDMQKYAIKCRKLINNFFNRQIISQESNSKKQQQMDYLDSGDYKLTLCTNSVWCTHEFLYKHKDIHDRICQYRKIKCEDCGVTVTRSGMITHWNNFCDRSIERSCDVCGVNFLKRSDLKCHQRTKILSNTGPICVNKGGVCYFSRYGCDFKCDEGDVNTMKEHLEHNCDKRRQRIALPIIKSLKKCERLEKSLEKMKSSLSEYLLSVAESAPVFDSVQMLLESLKGDLPVLARMPEVMETSDEKNWTKVKYLQRRLNEWTRLIDDCLIQLNILPTHCSKISTTIIQQQYKQMETEMLSPVPINGELVWKIEHWDNVRSAAQRNETTSIYSEFFFTSLYGYKMRLRLYPNGDGANRDRFVSCFFTIMKGPYDHILQWPFMRRMSFAVVNPQTDYKADEVQVIFPDGGAAFCRPEAEQNPITGCPNFIDLNKLNQYVDSEDDALTVICTVETSPSMDSWRQKVERYSDHD